MNKNMNFYTIKDLQQILMASRPTVLKLIKMDEFQTVKIGGSVRINVNSFDCWLYGENEKVVEVYRKKRKGDLPKTYSVSDFANSLQICEKTARKIISENKLNCLAWNDKRLTIKIPDMSLENFIENEICA